MDRVLIKIEDETLGNSSFISGEVGVSDISLMQNPANYSRASLADTLDSLVDRVKRAYRLPKTSPWTPEEIGAAIKYTARFLDTGTDKELGETFIRFMAAGEDQ